MGYDRAIERNAAGRGTLQPIIEQMREPRGRQYQRQYGEVRNAGPQSTRQPSGHTGKYRTAARRKACKRRKRRRQALGFLKFALCLALVFGMSVAVRGAITPGGSLGEAPEMGKNREMKSPILPEEDADALYADGYGEDLAKLLELNEEAADYVKCYPERENYKNQPIDLTNELQADEVPLLMQWDKRWGYNAYGNNMIGLAGCGPVCLTMAYLHFTGDTAMTPREMAVFANDNGYYTGKTGTKWSLWTAGAEKLGLTGEELPLDENVMKQMLDMGKLIVCSVGPGDFTTEGHFILIRGYDGNGFYVNDPNRRSNSEKQWDYDTLQGQILNLWALSE